jgi:hypothetical protein
VVLARWLTHASARRANAEAPEAESVAMPRRTVLKQAATIPLLASGSRIRPGDPAWPDEANWARLNSAVGGRLIKAGSPLAACREAADTATCRETLKNLRNPFYVRDQPGVTQCSGWADAWMPAPSAYAVAAEGVADVVAAVNFARENNLRLVIKGGGHSYQGTSCAPDSLLIWTRHMDWIVLHDAFVPQGCAGQMAAQPAVEIGAGAIWLHVYQKVTGKGGRFVRGGGCTTVGVAGLVQSGGFGNFPKKFGTAAGSLLEAEIVTADGQVRVVNACRDPDLFWAVKGGGGGTFGVVTKLVMKTYELPEALADAQLTVKAASDEAFRRLIGQFIAFYRDRLFNPHWDGSFHVRHDNTLAVSMLSQGLDALPAGRVWRPFLDWIAASPQDYHLLVPPTIDSMAARDWWNADFRRGMGISPPGSLQRCLRLTAQSTWRTCYSRRAGTGASIWKQKRASPARRPRWRRRHGIPQQTRPCSTPSHWRSSAATARRFIPR